MDKALERFLANYATDSLVLGQLSYILPDGRMIEFYGNGISSFDAMTELCQAMKSNEILYPERLRDILIVDYGWILTIFADDRWLLYLFSVPTISQVDMLKQSVAEAMAEGVKSFQINIPHLEQYDLLDSYEVKPQDVIDTVVKILGEVDRCRRAKKEFDSYLSQANVISDQLALTKDMLCLLTSLPTKDNLEKLSTLVLQQQAKSSVLGFLCSLYSIYRNNKNSFTAEDKKC